MPEEVGNLVEQLSAQGAAHTENIVLDFGIDRFIHSISEYGTLLILGINVLFMFNAPISCINNPNPSQVDPSRVARSVDLSSQSLSDHAQTANAVSSRLQVTTALKGFLDYYCWEDLEDLDFQGGSQSSSDGAGSEPFDPRDLMGDMIYWLCLQALIFSISKFFWVSVVGGTVKGQILYVQQLMEKVTELADKVRDVVPQKVFPGFFNRDVYDKYSESVKPWLYSTYYPDEELKQANNASVNDRKFLNLLCSENMAHFWQYPYLTSLYVLKYLDNNKPQNRQTTNLNGDSSQAVQVEKGPFLRRRRGNSTPDERDRLDHRSHRLNFIQGQNEAMSDLVGKKNRVDKLEAVLRIWTHQDNMVEKYLVRTYVIKHVMHLIFALVLMALNIVYFTAWRMPYKDLPTNKYTCKVESVEVEATCIIGGYTDYFILFWTNIALQAIVVVMSVSAIYLLFRKKMRHHSAYFMNFLANSTLIFSEVETQRMVDEDELNDSDFAPSDSE